MATVDQTQDSTESMQTVLTEMLAVLSDGRDFAAATRQLLEVLTSAFACQGALFFRFEEQKSRLVLVCASGSTAYLAERAELALGESAIGLAAQRRESVLERGASSDENRNQRSGEEDPLLMQLALPLLAKDGRLIGVLAMQAFDHHVLGEQEPALRTHIAPLVVSILEQLQRNEQAARWKEQLAQISALSHITSTGLELGLDELVQRIAALSVELLGVDLSVVLLFQPNSGQLAVQGVFPPVNRRTLPRRAITVEAGDWQELRSRGGHCSERLNPVHDTSYTTLLSAPLIVGNEFVGLLNCYTRAQRHPSAEEQTLLTTIANQAAVAIKLSLLSDLVAQRQQADAFLGDLLRGTYDEQALLLQGGALGLDLSRAHVVALVELIPLPVAADAQGKTQTEAASAGAWLAQEAGDGRINWIRSEMRRWLLQKFPGSLIAGGQQEHRLTCLLNLRGGTSSAQLTGGLRELVQQGRSSHRVQLFMGVSTACQHPSEYRRGFLEAEQALGMARRRKREGGVLHFNDLGVYRYIMTPAGAEQISDQYVDDVRRLDEYDRRKGVELLDTLETYLEHQGNLTQTSHKLDIHRNTLIQRLERMNEVCTLDLEDRTHWLALQVAIKWFKLQAS